ncbi:eukaryotic translation initiation factor 3 subunit C-like [Clavelina lepadiformis]|uniref:eukaryotic translation initiation factor 3 subunit C-like n=1 Tax=Clavelina lepadiformis TaxID=159417 RepID=UPI004041E703
MSKFYAAESSSDTDETSSDDDVPVTSTRSKAISQKRFLLSEDEEETTHVVLSAKEKCWEGLKDIIKLMQNVKKIRDMSKLLDEFENITKFYNKSKAVILKEGIPRFYIKILVETEDYVNELWQDKEARKKMSKPNSKAHGTLRQKIRKYLRDFEKEVTDYRENPDVDEKEQAVPESLPSPDKSDKAKMFLDKPLKPANIPMAANDDDDDDDDDDWPSDTSESSDESDEGGIGGRQLTADYFLKKTVKDDADEKSKRKDRGKEPRDTKKKKEEDNEEWEQVRGFGKAKVTLFEKDTEITHEVVMNKLNEITINRGRRSTIRKDQVELLKQLRQVAEDNKLGIAMTIRLTFDLIAGLFDYNSKILDCMKPEPWNDVLGYVEEVIDLLLDNPDIVVAEHIAVESENVSDKEAGFRISGSPVTLVEKLHSEYIKILQHSDAHSTEYVKHLREEVNVVNVIKKLKKYVEYIGSSQNICNAYILLIEYVYYKYDHKAIVKGKAAASEDKGDEVDEEVEDPSTMMKQFCQYIYAKDSTDRIRTRAILHHIYHHSLHDRWYEARDLMLMSHLQEMIDLADIPTRIIYNRTMVQLGLCAFRRGLMKEAHHALVDIQSTGRAKELLAQGLLLQRQGERITPEQEKVEKRRQIPFHMHINLELLECVYLVSAMLLEIPYIAAHEFDARRRMISKQFHHQLRVSERQSLLGPPENMREHVVAAAKALKMGDCETCLKFIINDKMNNKVWNLFSNSNAVRSMLEMKIREESLCTYLFTYSQFYDNISLNWLSSMFGLDRPACHQIVSKLIINEELAASWDEPSSSLVLHRTEPTRLQNMAMQLSEKVSTLVEINERILEAKVGGGGFQSYRQDSNYQGNRTNFQSNRSGGQGYQGRSGNSNYQNNRSGAGYQSGRGYQGNQSGRGYQGNQSGRGYQGNQSGRGYQGNQSGRGFHGKQSGRGYQGNQSGRGFQGNRSGYHGGYLGGYHKQGR